MGERGEREAMNRDNGALVTDEPAEIDHFRWIYEIYLKLMKKIWKMSTCNRLDMETLRSQPIMVKNLHGHCIFVPLFHPT